MVTKAQMKASAKYNKESIKRCTVVFSPNETDVYEFVKTKDNFSGYIKELIKADMAGRILPPTT